MRIETYDLNDGKICIPIAESYKDCMELIKSDRYRISGKVESTVSIIRSIIKPFDSSFLFWFRLSQYRGWLIRICRFMYRRASRKDQIQIPTSVRIGYGFYLSHGICIVVNEGTIIGNNVNISQFLNIGTNHNTPAIIGDNVYIGPQVSIVEDIRIGNNSTIGAGAVVTKDVPKNATVAGVPAKVLNYNNPGRYILYRWPLEV